MPETNDDVVIRLRAQVDQLKGDLDKAQKTIEGFGEKAKSTFGEIGAALAGAFAAEKILGFIKEGITAFAEYERALDSLGKKVTSSGGNWADLKESVEAYARGIKETTRFSDDEAVNALNSLMLKTNDYTTALKLNERAMNLSVLANIPLSESAQMLGLAYQGNARGVMMLGRQLGLTRGEAKDAQAVFDLLDERSKGLARTEDNLATNLEKAKHQFEDTGKAVGEALAPAVSYIAHLLSVVVPKAVDMVIKAFQSLGAIWGYEVLTALNYIDLWKDRIVSFAEFMLHVWRHPIDAWKQMHKDMETANKTFVKAQEDRDTALSEVSAGIWNKTANKKNEIDVKALNDHLVIKKKAKADEISDAKSELDFYNLQQKNKVTIFTAFQRGVSDVHEKFNKTRAKTDTVYAEEFKNRQKEIAESAKATFTAITQFAQGMADTLAAIGATWVTEWKNHTLTLLGAFKSLAQGIVRYMLKAIGKALVEEGAASFAKGIAALLTVVGAAAAPGFFAAGAELSAAGGVIMGIADSVKLASGGIVTKPTRALIGEAGPEAVIPLGKGGAGVMGDTTFKGTQMVFPGVKNAGDLEGTRFQQTAERVLAETWQRMNNRKGIKVPA